VLLHLARGADVFEGRAIAGVVEEHEPAGLEVSVDVQEVRARGLVGVGAVDVGEADRPAEIDVTAEDVGPRDPLLPLPEEVARVGLERVGPPRRAEDLWGARPAAVVAAERLMILIWDRLNAHRAYLELEPSAPSPAGL
jgi:hypothetical protein